MKSTTDDIAYPPETRYRIVHDGNIRYISNESPIIQRFRRVLAASEDDLLRLNIDIGLVGEHSTDLRRLKHEKAIVVRRIKHIRGILKENK